jgi:uncharacterized protein (TIGR02145 family)
MKHIYFIFITCFLAHIPLLADDFDFSTIEKDSVTDYDGNVYPTVKIGDYWWLAGNLRTRHYNDGTSVPFLGINGITDYDNAEQGYTYPDFDSTLVDTYGLLYTWKVATDTSLQGICPCGWKLTDTTAWFELARTLGGTVLYDYTTRPTPSGGTETVYEAYGATLIGQYLKSDNGVLWKRQASISTSCNQAGMNIVPAGYVESELASYFGRVSNIWTSNYVHADSSGQGRRTIWFSYDTHEMSTARYHNANPTTVRCIKQAQGTATGGNTVVTTSDVTVYPNPTAGNITIRSSLENGLWSIRNAEGICVRSGSTDSGSLSVDISELPQGLYIMSVSGKGLVKQVKILKI